MRIEQGVTLVEIMVALAVVGILAVVAIPAYQEYSRSTDTNKCATYIVAARLNATNLISLNNGDLTGIDTVTLGLTNSNNECSGGITVTTATGELAIAGITGSFGATAAVSRTFTMTRSAVGGVWSCGTTDSGGTVIQAGSCIQVHD